MGQLANLDLDGRMQCFLNQHDIIAFTHIGHDATILGQVRVTNAMRCIGMASRPHKPESGGIAIYAKRKWAPYMEVVQQHDEFGILWVRVHGAPRQSCTLFIAVIYFPPYCSNYYDRDGGRDVEEHYSMLQHDIAHFSGMGKVILMGDFNARIGRHPGLAQVSAAEDRAMQAAGIPLPRTYELSLPRRVSMDGYTNSMGKHLLELCSTSGLAILNGRITGDIYGAYTYYGWNGGHSVVDYVISSPDLIFDGRGQVHDGIHMNVRAPVECPVRRNGGRFDHAAVSVVIRLDVAVPDQHREMRDELHESDQTNYRLVWRKELQGEYVKLLMYDSEIAQLAANIMNNNTSGTAAADAFKCMIWCAARKLHRKFGGVVKSGRGIGGANQRLSNRQSWYTDECRRLRAQLRQLECRHGHDHDICRNARRTYFLEVRRAKRQYVRQNTADYIRQLYHEPRTFWNTYKQGGRGACAISDVNAWSHYFDRLLRANNAGTYYGSSIDAHCRQYGLLFKEPDVGDIQSAASLNAPITKVDVMYALHTLGNGKSAGADGMPGEFLRCATFETTLELGGGKTKKITQNVLADWLVCMFNKVLLCYQYPPDWSVGALVPVPKPKGNASNMDDYRGIAVGAAVSKVYANVILHRIDQWAEARSLRANGQFGFRHGRGTIDAAFILKHVIDRYGVDRKPVFAAFIDFKKAYDRVDRGLLWRCLQSMGLHGACLETLKLMYHDVRLRVRIGGKLGPEFKSTVGVKQGDPISPLLFGLFIDRFEQFLAEKAGDSGVKICDQILRVLFYADDLVLLAESQEQLQQQMDALSSFCDAFGLCVNAGKSEIVVFNSRFGRREAAQIEYKGSVLPCKSEFTYLGVHFADAAIPRKVGKAAAHAKYEKGRACYFAMLQRCNQMKLANPHIMCRLFDSLVVPVLSYGCEIWGPDVIGTNGADLLKGEVELLHRTFLRSVLGVRKSTPVAVLMHELYRCPIMCTWLDQICRFWNRIWERRDCNDWTYLCLVDSIQMASHCHKGWAHSVMRIVDKLTNSSISIVSDTGGRPVCCDIRAVLSWAYDKWHGHAWSSFEAAEQAAAARCHDPANESLVHSCPDDQHTGFKLLKYDCWFKGVGLETAASRRWARMQSYMGVLHKHSHIRIIAQFRTASHWLGCETLRPTVSDRSKRCCVACRDECEDEHHMLKCPLYTDIREKYSNVIDFAYVTGGGFSGTLDQAMQHVVNGYGHEFWTAFACFLLDCKDRRQQVVDGCWPVARV